MNPMYRFIFAALFTSDLSHLRLDYPQRITRGLGMGVLQPCCPILQQFMQSPKKYERIISFSHPNKISSKVCEKYRTSVSRGIVDQQFFVQKHIVCSHDQELFLKSILLSRKSGSIAPNHQNCFSTKNMEIESEQHDNHTHFYIYTRFISSNYEHMLKFTKKEGLKQVEILRNILNITSKVIIKLMTHSNNQLYTLNSFLFQGENTRDMDVTINRTSFTGMHLILNNQEICQGSLSEMLYLLQSSTLDQQPHKRLNVQLKFRAIGILILSLWFGFQSFQLNLPDPQGNDFLTRYKKLTKMLPEAFTKILKGSRGRSLQEVEDKYKLKYFTFVQKVFVQEESLTWSQVIDLLIPKIKQQRMQQLEVNFTNIASKIFKESAFHPQELIRQLCLEDPKMYLLALLNEEETKMDTLLKYKELDDYLEQQKVFNPQTMAIYRKLLEMVSLPNSLEHCCFQIDEVNLYQSIMKVLSSRYGIYKTPIIEKLYTTEVDKSRTLRRYHHNLR